MTYEEWQAANLPKIQGTWNLHEAFASQFLDFFVLFSSFSGLLGHWGQANYASANTFLDAFAQYRHGKGLPASVLDISIIEDVGWVSQEPAHLDQLKATVLKSKISSIPWSWPLPSPRHSLERPNLPWTAT
jgi:hypothetical protein